MLPLPKLIRILILCCLLWPVSSALTANEIKLPVLGDASSGMISKSQEYELGRTWLKIFRSRVRAYDDPLMQIYLEQLLYNLATYSDLEDPRLELVIVKNPSMNAFAVPGGVVGFTLAYLPLLRMKIKWPRSWLTSWHTSVNGISLGALRRRKRTQ